MSKGPRVAADSAASRATLQRGERLAGRYRVDRCLGRGGMGEVYAVFDEHLQEPVALKLLRFTEDGAAESFKREVRLARRITHPNVARTHDIGEHEGLLFLTMERIDGSSLEALIEGREGPFELAQGTSLLTAIARGLEAAHAAGVVHRDLKPANVMVQDDGRVTITDFGVARQLASGDAKASRIVGTPRYMAPEQVLGGQVVPTTDVYAFGLVAYELLTASFPFQGESPMATLYARCHQPPTDPRRHRQEMPDEVAELLLRCLALEPQARPTAASLVHELSQGRQPTPASGTLVAHAGTVAASPSSWPLSGGGLPVSEPFAPLEPGGRALAVLPFAYRGPSDHDYLGDSLSQELIDVLSRSRGLRVLAFGATKELGRERDPRSVGRKLAADSMVDGSVFVSGDQVRLSVRLVEVKDGEQIWSDRYAGDLGDVFAMQEITSQRIAETLRVELSVAAHRARLPPPAMGRYLAARRELEQRHFFGAIGAVELLEESLELAPDFPPAVAAHAVACVRAWWTAFTHPTDGDRDYGEAATESVARALECAPQQAESHLAAAMLAIQHGDWRTMARELAETLAIAPTCGEAHRYLGELQCEAGRVREGLQRLQLAVELDPSSSAAWFCLARAAALRGDYERVERYVEQAEHHQPEASLPALLLRMRAATWRQDEVMLRGHVERMERSGELIAPVIASFGRYCLGELEADAVDRVVEMFEAPNNARMASLVHQLAIEGMCFRGDHDRAAALLERTSQAVLVDVEWLDRCPALEPLRSSEIFDVASERARVRARGLWRI